MDWGIVQDEAFWERMGMSIFYTGFCALGFLFGQPGFPGTPFRICNGLVSLNWADNYLHAGLTAGFAVSALLMTLRAHRPQSAS